MRTVKQFTTIAIYEETKERLEKYRRYRRDTWNDIVSRVLDLVEKAKKSD